MPDEQPFVPPQDGVPLIELLVCIGCNRKPSEIPEYRDEGAANEMTPDQFVLREEGTLNRSNGHFACSECYIKMGMPASPTGWVAP